jgi:hypothetical protein
MQIIEGHLGPYCCGSFIQLLLRRITIMLLLHVPYYNYNEVLGREQHDMSAACPQGKEQLMHADY